jgi:WD40 repeat protein
MEDTAPWLAVGFESGHVVLFDCVQVGMVMQPLRKEAKPVAAQDSSEVANAEAARAAAGAAAVAADTEEGGAGLEAEGGAGNINSHPLGKADLTGGVGTSIRGDASLSLFDFGRPVLGETVISLALHVEPVLSLRLSPPFMNSGKTSSDRKADKKAEKKEKKSSKKSRNKERRSFPLMWGVTGSADDKLGFFEVGVDVQPAEKKEPPVARKEAPPPKPKPRSGLGAALFEAEAAADITGSSSGDLAAEAAEDKAYSPPRLHMYEREKGYKLQNKGVAEVAIRRHDERLVASAGWDHRVRIFDWRKLVHLAALNFHSDSVYTIDFSADGRLLATGSKDNRVALWEIYPPRGSRK